MEKDINRELIEYIENNIFPEYSKNEKAHGIEHIQNVIRKSLKLAKKYDVNFDMVYVIAAYHDIGHHIDRKRHEIISAEIFMKDEKVKRWFTDEQRNIMKEAIEDHRASSNSKPRTIYGMIVSTADTSISNVDTEIKRAYSYGLKHYSEFSYEEQIEEVYNHLTEKYGENGYAKIYLEDEEHERTIRNLRQALSNKIEFIERVKEVTSKM